MSNDIQLDDILDNCLERILIKGETIEQCLESFPEYSDELEPLLEMAMTTKQVTTIEPRPEFKEQAKYRFQMALRESGQKKSWPIFNWRLQQRWVTAVAIVLVVLLTTSGTVAIASNRMPDSPLYEIKLATERVQLTLTFSEMRKAELHAGIADKRVNEIIYLADKGSPEEISQITDSLDSHLSEISFLVSAPVVMSGDAMITEPAIAVQDAPPKRAIPNEEAVEVTIAATEAPQEPITPTLTGPEELPAPLPSTKEVNEEALSTVDTYSSDNPRADLIIKITNQFNYNIASLRALLETAPESARPALVQAISILEKGYRDAIMSLNQP